MTDPRRAPSAAPRLEAVGLTRRFGAIEALRDVSLALHAGEVVALVGENGAGKSTLIKILAGILRPDAGGLRIDGEPAELSSPSAAMARGIAVIHQELQLCDNLSIAANLFLGREPLRARALGWIDRTRREEAARRALERVGLDRDPREPVAALSPAARQLVEIARALAMDASVVVMDEPTSSLGREESARLLALVEDLRRGAAVLYVSHRLEEVVRVADRAVVLRDGRVAGRLERGEIDDRTLVRLMVGRDMTAAVRTAAVHAARGGRAGPTDDGSDAATAATATTTATPPPPLLSVRDLRVATGSPGLSFDLLAGEILGLFGLVGAGRTELLETLFGLRRAAAGSIEVAGRSQRRGAWSVAAAVAAGLALVPEERKTQGLVAEMSVAENLALAELSRRPLLARRRRRDERRRAAALCRALDVRPAAPDARVGRLSGGNQQKVALGKWLSLEPRVLLLDEPTRGVDVGARDEIHRRLRALADGGVGIVLSSAETDEILALADRVLVLYRGAMAGIVEGAERSDETLVRLAAGGVAPAPAA